MAWALKNTITEVKHSRSCWVYDEEPDLILNHARQTALPEKPLKTIRTPTLLNDIDATDRLYRNYRWYGENDGEIEISWIQSFFFNKKKLTILSIMRALRRADFDLHWRRVW
jgi:hypothetical protein